MKCEIVQVKFAMRSVPPRIIIYGAAYAPDPTGLFFGLLERQSRIVSSYFRTSPKTVDQRVDAYSRVTPHNHGTMA